MNWLPGDMRTVRSIGGLGMWLWLCGCVCEDDEGSVCMGQP